MLPRNFYFHCLKVRNIAEVKVTYPSGMLASDVQNVCTDNENMQRSKKVPQTLTLKQFMFL